MITEVKDGIRSLYHGYGKQKKAHRLAELGITAVNHNIDTSDVIILLSPLPVLMLSV